MLFCSPMLLFQISCTDIGIQHVYSMEDAMKMDFPPKIEMSLLSIPTTIQSDPLSLWVEGLSKEVIFTLNPGIKKLPKELPRYTLPYLLIGMFLPCNNPPTICDTPSSTSDQVLISGKEGEILDTSQIKVTLYKYKLGSRSRF